MRLQEGSREDENTNITEVLKYVTSELSSNGESLAFREFVMHINLIGVNML